MSYGARLLYLALLRQLSSKRYNNGNVYLATRKAAKELGANQGRVCIWFRELEHYGFIVVIYPGHIHKATRYRITDVGWGELDGKRIEPTKDYLRWNGELFERNRNANAAKTSVAAERKKHSLASAKSTQSKIECGSSALNGKSTQKEDQSRERKKHSDLDITISTVVDAGTAAWRGHDLGPPLDRLEWSTPVVEEIVGLDPRLVIPGDLTIPDFMKR